MGYSCSSSFPTLSEVSVLAHIITNRHRKPVGMKYSSFNFQGPIEHQFVMCYNLSVALSPAGWLQLATSDEPIVTK